jgi:hypothetical protein
MSRWILAGNCQGQSVFSTEGLGMQLPGCDHGVKSWRKQNPGLTALSFSLFIFDSVSLSRICCHVCLAAHRCHFRSHLLAPSSVFLSFALSPSLSLTSVTILSTLLAVVCSPFLSLFSSPSPTNRLVWSLSFF